jgi:hypothetical protein
MTTGPPRQTNDAVQASVSPNRQQAPCGKRKYGVDQQLLEASAGHVMCWGAKFVVVVVVVEEEED